MNLKSVFERGLILILAASVTSSALGATFTVGISPSKFELSARPGDVVRETVTITNPGEDAATYLFKTTDWELNNSGSVEYFGDEIDADSCRPWVRLERRSVEIAADGEKNYRFEVHVPEDAPDGLCRFAIIIEPTDPYVASSEDGQVSMPILGRFAVLTYVTIGEARADIEMLGLETTLVNGQKVPAIRLANRGNTYDRAYGQLTASDADGNRTFLDASDFPVLPGRTEAIALIPADDGAGSGGTALSYPILVQGRVEIGGQRLTVDGILE